MRFTFTEEQLELRAAVRQVLERECTTADVRAAFTEDDPAAGRSAERWAVLAELGAPGLVVPEAHGGLGLGPVDLVGVLEEAGWAALPEPLAETAALAAPLLTGIANLGGPAGEQAAAWLEELAGGRLVATVGGVTPAVGGLVPTTRLETEVATGLAVTPLVVGIQRAELYLLAGRFAGTGLEVHAVEAAVAMARPTPSIDGARDLGTVEWVPSDATRLATGPDAARLLEALADRAAVATAAQLLGLADRMIILAADYAKVRQQFGKPIGSFQAVKHLLADARVALEFARPVVYRAAWSLGTRAPSASHDASMAKAVASDAADLAGRHALQVHGAIGYTWECDLQLFMKKAWALSGAWGDAPTHRALVLEAALDARSR